MVKLTNKGTLQCSETVKCNTFQRTCCYCRQDFLMTPEEYAFNTFGRQVVDRSINEVSGWVCPKCAEEIIRIKNL